MKILALLFTLAPLAAWAEVAKIRSGNHADFTRLTVTTEQKHGWSLGRTNSGYALSIDTKDPRFDLTEVYRAIGHERLQTIWADPSTGALHLGIACACHIIPFEFSDSVLVLDIKPGPPPENSIYEKLIETDEQAGELADVAAAQRPRSRPKAENQNLQDSYDWTETLHQSLTDEVSKDPHKPVFGAAGELDFPDRLAFQGQLAAALAQAATAGFVEMELPAGPTTAHVPPDDPQIRLSVGDLPQVSVAQEAGRPESMATGGHVCPERERVTLREWQPGEADAYFAMAISKQAILAEFDQADANAILESIRTHLYFGFGAEALAISEAFPSEANDDPYVEAIAQILESQVPSRNPFEGMQSCGNAAALWALIADPEHNFVGTNAPAVAAAFRELPSHIKPLLALSISEKLLALGFSSEAEQVRSAVARATPESDPHADLVAAKISLHDGNVDKAEASLKTAKHADGNSEEREIERLLLETERRHQKMEPLAPEDLLALQSFAFTLAKDDDTMGVFDALSIALALAGDFDAAFETAANPEKMRPKIWEIMGAVGPESSVLNFAIGMEDDERNRLARGIIEQLALRLRNAGLPNAALTLVGETTVSAELRASLLLEAGDPKLAVREASRSPDAQEVLADALTQIGAFKEASVIKEKNDQNGASLQLRRWAGEFDEKTTDGAWTALRLAMENPTTETTPIATAEELLVQSETTRLAVTSLLKELPDVD